MASCFSSSILMEDEKRLIFIFIFQTIIIQIQDIAGKKKTIFQWEIIKT